MNTNLHRCLGANCTCGCCAGATARTPRPIENQSGLSTISYRAGAYSDFRQSLIAGLTSSAHPALQGLGTRANDDFTIALLDAWAVASDVLTFYQERIANESWLATATERFSLLESSRLIGYRLRPGVAASTWIAFTLETAPGSPATISIPPGVKIQSVPGPGESPQTFETTETIEARPTWNAIPALQARPQPLDHRTRQLYLRGTSTQLKPGDGILIVGDERIEDVANDNWDFRILTSVIADSDHDRTAIAWRDPLGQIFPVVSDPAKRGARLFALRQRTALFGHNAPKPALLNLPSGNGLVDANTKQWLDYVVDAEKIDLDAVYPGIVPGGWMVLDMPAGKDAAGAILNPYTELCRITQVTSLSRSDFAISAKLTRVIPDGFENHDNFKNRLQEITAFAQSEELEIIATPIHAPVVGQQLELAQLEPDLQPGRRLAASGPRQHIRITPDFIPTTPSRIKRLLESADQQTISLDSGAVLQVLAPPVWSTGGAPLSVQELEQWLAGDLAKKAIWSLRTVTGFDGSLDFFPGELELIRPSKDAEIVRELIEIDNDAAGVSHTGGRTTIQLEAPLEHCFDREHVRFCANLAPATHGESVSEILGQGDASQRFQRFPLAQPPLTYVGATNPDGFASTLEVRVNDLLWTEVPNFFGHTSAERIYVTAQADDGITSVIFGDAKTGARLPTGSNNVRASYRKGIGRGGLLAAGQLSQLMTRPLGVTGAINPRATEGAVDPETLPEVREKAPLSVRTMGRAVSVQDYEDFARAFIGIGKASAIWLWDGRLRRILITAAGLDGAEVDEKSDLYDRLVSALAQAGDPLVQFAVRPCRNATFAIDAHIKIDTPLFVPELVMAQITAHLDNHFSFAKRNFGAPIALSEVYAAIHEIPGVLGVDIDEFFRLSPSSPGRVGALGKKLPVRLLAEQARLDEQNELVGAELLTIDLSASKLEVMA